MAIRALLRLVLASLMLAGTSAFAGTVLVWGDSLSAGYGLRPNEAWPILLEQRIGESKLPHKVINASISGETTAGGRSRLPAALQAYKPSVVIIELGANDGLRGLPASAMVANLQAMIDASKQAGAKVLLIGMRMPPNYGPAYTRRFQATYTDVATRTGVPLVPFLFEGFADQADKFQSDGIHPRADAQITMLDTIWPHLTPLLD